MASRKSAIKIMNSSPRMNCSDRPLKVLPLDGATYWFGVGGQLGNRQAQSAADRLRDSIGKLAERGDLVSVDFRWNSRLGAEATTVFAYHNISGVPDIEDLHRGAFQGASIDARIRLLDRERSPFGFTVSIERTGTGLTIPPGSGFKTTAVR